MISGMIGWLVVLRINVDLAIFQPYLNLEAGDNQSLKIQMTRPGIKPRSFCSASQELNHSATAAPFRNERGETFQMDTQPLKIACRPAHSEPTVTHNTMRRGENVVCMQYCSFISFTQSIHKCIIKVYDKKFFYLTLSVYYCYSCILLFFLYIPFNFFNLSFIIRML